MSDHAGGQSQPQNQVGCCAGVCRLSSQWKVTHLEMSNQCSGHNIKQSKTIFPKAYAVSSHHRKQNVFDFAFRVFFKIFKIIQKSQNEKNRLLRVTCIAAFIKPQSRGLKTDVRTSCHLPKLQPVYVALEQQLPSDQDLLKIQTYDLSCVAECNSRFCWIAVQWMREDHGPCCCCVAACASKAWKSGDRTSL